MGIQGRILVVLKGICYAGSREQGTQVLMSTATKVVYLKVQRLLVLQPLWGLFLSSGAWCQCVECESGRVVSDMAPVFVIKVKGRKIVNSGLKSHSGG